MPYAKTTEQFLLTLACLTFTTTMKSKGRDLSTDCTHIYEYATTQFVYFEIAIYKLLTSKNLALNCWKCFDDVQDALVYQPKNPKGISINGLQTKDYLVHCVLRFSIHRPFEMFDFGNMYNKTVNGKRFGFKWSTKQESLQCNANWDLIKHVVFFHRQ